MHREWYEYDQLILWARGPSGRDSTYAWFEHRRRFRSAWRFSDRQIPTESAIHGQESRQTLAPRRPNDLGSSVTLHARSEHRSTVDTQMR